MVQRKRKEHRMTGDGVSTEDTRKRKRKNYADSAGTDGAIEGQSPPENCTNAVSRANTSCKTSQTETNSFHQTSSDSPSCCKTFHSTTSCTSYSFVNSASSTFPSSLATRHYFRSTLDT